MNSIRNISEVHKKKRIPVTMSLTPELLEAVRELAEREYGWLADCGHPMKYLVDFTFMRLCRAGLREAGMQTSELPYWLERRQEPRRIIAFPGVS